MYLEIDEGFSDHLKTLHLCALMKDRHADTYVVRLWLWLWALRNALDGVLRIEASEIERVSGYPQCDGELLKALSDPTFGGWLRYEESNYVIVGWNDYAGAPIRRPRERSSLYGDPLWLANRRIALARDGACVKCGSLEMLDVHHRIPARIFEGRSEAHSLENLVVLCRSHHAEADQRYRQTGDIYPEWSSC
jgi:hypothetical protein